MGREKEREKAVNALDGEGYRSRSPNSESKNQVGTWPVDDDIRVIFRSSLDTARQTRSIVLPVGRNDEGLDARAREIIKRRIYIHIQYYILFSVRIVLKIHDVSYRGRLEPLGACVRRSVSVIEGCRVLPTTDGVGGSVLVDQCRLNGHQILERRRRQ